MADLIPFTALTAGNLNTTYSPNVVVTSGVGGTVTVNTNIYIDGSGNVGIGTSTIASTTKMAVYGGNLQIGTTGFGIRFSDGTFQSTSSAITVTNDTTTNTNTFYPSLTNNVTSGALSGLTTSSTKLFYNPSTGTLTATALSGNLEGGYVSGTVLNARTSLIAQTISSNATITAGTGLTVSAGGASITGNLTVTGNLLITGNTNTISSNVLVVDDPIIYMGDNNPANIWDMGIVASYTATTYKHTGMMRNQTDGTWTFFDNLITEPTQTINWNQTGLIFPSVKMGNVNVAAATASTSSSTGAIVTAGGAGIAGALNVGGQAYVGSLNSAASAIVNSLTSNGAVSGTTITASTGYEGGYHSGTIFNARTSLVAATVTSNGAVSGTSGTFTAGLYGAQLNTGGTATVNALTSNGAVSGTTITASTGYEGGYHSGTIFNARTSLIAGSVTSNGAISGTTITPSTGLEGGYVSGTIFNARTSLVAATVTSNGAVSGTSGTFTAGLYGATFNTAGTATVNAVSSNGSVTGTTIIPTGSSAPTNGMFLPTTNAVGFATNSNERMRIDSSGNVSIGGTGVGYPSAGRISLTLNGTSQTLLGFYTGGVAQGYLYTDGTNMTLAAQTGSLVLSAVAAQPVLLGTNGVERMRIDGTGKVGIGTTAPSNALTVQTGTQYDGILLKNGSATTVGYLVGASATNDDGQLALNSGGVNKVSLLANGTSYFVGGYVGIGTTTATGKLTIYGTGSTASAPSTSSSLGATIAIRDDSGAVGNGGMLMFGAQQGYFAAIKGYIRDGANSTTGDLIFATRNASTDSTLTERLRMVSDGKIGINTASPSYLLDVNGYARATTYLLTNTNDVTASGDGAGWVFGGNGYLYFNQSGYNYFTNRIYARGGIFNDTATYLLINGGSSNFTNFNSTGQAAYAAIYGPSTTYPTLSVGDSSAGFDNGGSYGMVNITRAADTTKAHVALIRYGSYVWQMGYVPSTNTFGIFPWNLNANGTPALSITTGSNVGIGTTNPLRKLHIQRSAGASSDGEIFGSDGTQWWMTNSNASGGSYNTLVQAGDTSFIYSNGSIETGALVIGPHSASSKGIRIDSSGNFGIGIASPSYKLDVAGDIRTYRSGGDGIIYLGNNGSRYLYWGNDYYEMPYASGLFIGHLSNGGDYALNVRAQNASYITLSGANYPNYNGIWSKDGNGYINWGISSYGNTNQLLFFTNDANERMRIDANGRVGIGIGTDSHATVNVGTQGIRVNNTGPVQWYGSSGAYNQKIWDIYSDNTSGNTLAFRCVDDGYNNGNNWLTVTRSGYQAQVIAFSVGTYERMRIAADGSIGINNASPAAKLDVVGTSRFTDHMRLGPYAGSTSTANVVGLEIMNNGGTGDGDVAAMSFHCQNQYGTHLHLRNDGVFGAGGWSASTWRWYCDMQTGNFTIAGTLTQNSDPRLKDEITSIETPLEKLSQLNGVRFKWKDNPVVGEPGKYDYGVLSSDVQKVMPELVIDSIHDSPDGDRYKTVAYDKLVALLIEAVKDQQKQIDYQQQQIDELKSTCMK